MFVFGFLGTVVMYQIRVCSMCLASCASTGEYRCTQECPRRRGWHRSHVVTALQQGMIPPGLHPDSRLLREAMDRVNMQDTTSNNEVGALRIWLEILTHRVAALEEAQREREGESARLRRSHDEGNDSAERRSFRQAEDNPSGSGS